MALNVVAAQVQVYFENDESFTQDQDARHARTTIETKIPLNRDVKRAVADHGYRYACVR